MEVVSLDNSTFILDRLTESSFTANGRREWFQYRSLLSEAASSGQFGASMTRSTTGQENESTGWHYHTGILQLAYIIKGWAEVEFEKIGVERYGDGAFLNLPIGMLHNELSVSPDFESITFTVPAKLGTVPVAPPEGAIHL